MVIVRKTQMVGYFLNGHGGLAQQVHGGFQPEGEVIAVGRYLIFSFKHKVGSGAGEVGMRGNLVNAKGMVNIFFNEAFHGQCGGFFFLVFQHGIRKQLDMVMEQESQFAFAADWVFFHYIQSPGKVLAALEMFHIAVDV